MAQPAGLPTRSCIPPKPWKPRRPFVHVHGYYRETIVHAGSKETRPQGCQNGFHIAHYRRSGTGKRSLPRPCITAPWRRDGPFVKVTARIPNLLESDCSASLTSFTGAMRGGKPGKFELAEGGQFFLMEIGECRSPMQAKLLTVLQEKRSGADRRHEAIPVNVRSTARQTKTCSR